MAVVETLRVLKPVNVGCEKHGRLEARTLGHYAPEWMELPYPTLARLKRQKMVEAVTVDEEELVKFEQLHEEVWGSESEEAPSEQGEVSEGSEEESDPDETNEPEEILEEEDINLGPVEIEEDETEKQPKKAVTRRRTTRTRRSKTT